MVLENTLPGAGGHGGAGHAPGGGTSDAPSQAARPGRVPPQRSGGGLHPSQPEAKDQPFQDQRCP